MLATPSFVIFVWKSNPSNRLGTSWYLLASVQKYVGCEWQVRAKQRMFWAKFDILCYLPPRECLDAFDFWTFLWSHFSYLFIKFFHSKVALTKIYLNSTKPRIGRVWKQDPHCHCTQATKYASEGSTLALKPRADVTWSPKLGCQ